MLTLTHGSVTHSFESSATALSFITYALGKYPDVQEKVRQEVKDVVNEGAREDFEYQGIKYKAGTCIMSPVAVIHMDERFFPDPTKFDPDRYY
ncbi:cytochrome P450, putative [Ixodes scapularis]|uniref:Cytochrome P450, putative n=1 Tax=Ixodes scapularis TaxID=6945 RepID=B7P5J3_IXOSC|nr:cytochrome P450, putative [Ixodes scapularis]|eukprot:XP_002407457.1 cytochrome P450, putative [Ixodes scapularis]